MSSYLDQEIVHWEDVPALAGCQIETTVTVDEEHWKSFLHSSMMDDYYGEDLEHNWAHYPKGVLEGFHTLSLIDSLTRPFLRFDPDTCITYNYGLDKVRFTRMLVTEQELLLKARISKVREKPTGYVVHIDCDMRPVGDSEPAFIAEWLLMVVRRESSRT